MTTKREIKNYSDIKSYEDALAYLGKEDYSEWYQSNPDQSKVKKERALYKLETIIEAINKIEKWAPNWNDSSQKKWRPWFYLDSPFRFDDAFTDTSAGGPSHLHLPSEEIATYTGKQFIDLWKNICWIKL
jgi:hypothetical protein